MANKILKPSVKATGIVDMIELGLFKTATEAALTPIVGNGTLTSGAAKLVAGGLVSQITTGKHANLLAGGIVTDAVEDIAHAAIGYLRGGVAAPANDGW